LTDPKLAGELEGVLERAREAGVGWIVTIASDLSDSEATVRLAERTPNVFASVGVHPHAADSVDDTTFEVLRELLARPRVVALGETGLDYHYDNSPREVQRAVFERHLALAAELDRPVVVHAREADDDVIAMLRDSGWGRGVLHCFSSARQLMEEALSLGWFISFAGMITFPKWEGADLLRAVPLDRLLVETDSPYLSPVPHRGRRNEPAMVRVVAERAAALRSEPPLTLIRQTTINAQVLYGLPGR
jgi:TatD DNase family protein